MKKDKKGRVIIPDSFDRIKPRELKPGDILLFHYGNKLTEWHGRTRRKKYGRSKLPPFHAAIVESVRKEDDVSHAYHTVYILDPEMQTTLSLLNEYMTKSSYRIDVIRPDVPAETRRKVKSTIRRVATKEGFYDWKGYGAFVSQLWGLGWVKHLVKPSKKNFYCSDAVSYCWEKNGVRVSPRGHNFTAPVDLQLYAMKHPKTFDMYTLKARGE